jgi:Icc-related predicted phosphoesterase
MERRRSVLKLVILSDTHRQRCAVPDGDVLIHCGDHTYHGAGHESWEALHWLDTLPHKHKLIIAGNHELGWEREDAVRAILEPHKSLTYLHNGGVEIDGIKFWGSPVQPEFHGWAFQMERGEELAKHWEKIPEDVDVLITHGPPKGFGDTNTRDERFGDEDLLRRVLKVRPQIHCYGHAHHGYGEYFFEGIHFINAAILNEGYMVANKPVVVDVDARKH